MKTLTPQQLAQDLEQDEVQVCDFSGTNPGHAVTIAPRGGSPRIAVR